MNAKEKYTQLIKPEVHMILHSHGPAQPGEIANQIHTVDGGCDPLHSPLGFGPDSDMPGFCADIQAAIHPLVVLECDE